MGKKKSSPRRERRILGVWNRGLFEKRTWAEARVLFCFIGNSFGIPYEIINAPLRMHRVCPLGYANAKEDVADATHLRRRISLFEILSNFLLLSPVSEKYAAVP